MYLPHQKMTLPHFGWQGHIFVWQSHNRVWQGHFRRWQGPLKFTTLPHLNMNKPHLAICGEQNKKVTLFYLRKSGKVIYLVARTYSKCGMFIFLVAETLKKIWLCHTNKCLCQPSKWPWHEGSQWGWQSHFGMWQGHKNRRTLPHVNMSLPSINPKKHPFLVLNVSLGM